MNDHSLRDKEIDTEIIIPIYSGLYKSLIQYIDVSELVTSSRRSVGRECLKAFSASLSTHGFFRPLLTEKDGRIADGAKRYAAALSLGYPSVPCLPYPTPLVFEDDLLIRKLCGDELSFFEAADALRLLTEKHLYSQECAASAIGKSQSYVANKLRLFNFTPEERTKIEDSSVTERHCRTLLRIKDPAARESALDTVISAGMNVCAAEEFVSSLVSAGGAPHGDLASEIRALLRRYSDSSGLTASETDHPDGSVSFSISISKCFT